ncbi:MAG: methyltransferase domain-containing protein [Candidatus Moranbacteria bacterium]|nr:methyltransferase domain-containing protein [Candidatus Moranbacteria bacterium]MDD3964948.1 methyltransferase domain-containing protein [Candidatus Moranbacteria bacterium]
MRRNHLSYLSDPVSNNPFDIIVFEEAGSHVISGLVTTAGSWYPIINGIPRILIDELKTNLLQTHQDFFKTWKEKLPENIHAEWQKAIDNIPDLDAFWKHQKKTAESFAYEWKYIYKENNYEKSNFFHFLSPFLKEENLRGKKTLDIGCGSGRFTKWAGLSETEISFGTDLGETVGVAYEMTKDIPNICIVQADIYHMPFTDTFDIAYSIGVLHHLPKPQDGFSRLPKTLRAGGKMLIWVYNRRNNARALYFYEPLRDFLKKLPKPILFKLCYIPGFIVHLINLFGKLLKMIGFKSLATKLPFAYYENFPFNMKLNDAFDVLATPKSNYYYVEEIEKWFSDSKLEDVQSFEHPEAGITCVGTH